MVTYKNAKIKGNLNQRRKKDCKIHKMYLTIFLKIKNCAQFFINTYALTAFNFFAILDFFLAAVFFTITPLVQA